MVTFADTVI